MARKILIDNWQLGIAQSSFSGAIPDKEGNFSTSGFSDMRNVDVWSEPGVAKISLRTVKATATVDRVRWFTTNSDDPRMIFGLTESQKLLKSTDTGATWSTVTGNNSGSGGGLTFWKRHVITARNSGIEALGPPYTSSDWNALTPTIDFDGDYHPMISAQDDILYGGAGRYILSLQEVSGTTFAAGTVTTYTLTPRALDLPNGYRVKCLEELGELLEIGTFQGSANVTNGNYQIRVADIFPWDRTSDSFNTPIRLNEAGGVNQMLNSNNILYINAGTQGRYYVSDGSNTQPLFSIPPQIANPDSSTFFVNEPGAIAKHEGEVLFGTSGNTFGFGGQGVYGYIGNSDVIKNVVSNLQDGSGTANIEIGAIHNVGPTDYLVSWSYGGVDYGIDKVSTTRYAGYAARIDSPFYRSKNPNNPDIYKQLQFSLAEPLTTGQGIRFSFRTSTSDSFSKSNPYTFDFASHGAIQDGVANIDAEAKNGIQVRIELTTASGTANTPKLQSVWIQ